MRYSLDTNANTRFYQVSTSELIRVVGARDKVETLYIGTEKGFGHLLGVHRFCFFWDNLLLSTPPKLAFQNGVSQRAKRSK